MQFEVLTDIGRKRTVNEDSAAVFTLKDGPALAIVADGMGGHRGGDYASSTAVQLIGEKYTAIKDYSHFQNDDWIKWLNETITFVNDEIYSKAMNDPDLKGMGTTLDAVLLFENRGIITHVGDSRVYIIEEKTIQQVTKDHSFVNVLLESGEITEEEAEVHPQRNWIMRALGSEASIVPDFYQFTFDIHSSYVLICTDGLSNKVTTAQILTIVTSKGNLHEKAARLIGLANELGGEDNISVILTGPSVSEVDET